MAYTQEQIDVAISDMERMGNNEVWVCPLLSIMAGRPMECADSCAWNNGGTCAVYKLSMLEAIAPHI